MFIIRPVDMAKCTLQLPATGDEPTNGSFEVVNRHNRVVNGMIYSTYTRCMLHFPP